MLHQLNYQDPLIKVLRVATHGKQVVQLRDYVHSAWRHWLISHLKGPSSGGVPCGGVLPLCRADSGYILFTPYPTGGTVVHIPHATTFSDMSQNHMAPHHTHIHASNTVLMTPPHSLSTYYSLISMSRMLHFRQPHIHA